MSLRIVCLQIAVVSLFTICVPVASKTASGCYGTSPVCDYYTMECATSEIIRLGDLKVGVKDSTQCKNINDHCSPQDNCCSFASGDHTENFKPLNTFDTYTNCSGRSSCINVQSPWQQLSTGSTSTYVTLDYACEQASEQMQFCNSVWETKEGKYFQVMFDGSADKFNFSEAGKQCRCEVLNGGNSQILTLTAIDFRIQSYYSNQSQVPDCSSAHFSSQVANMNCISTTNYYIHNFWNNKRFYMYLQPGQKTLIQLLKLYEKGFRDSPAMIWFSLEAPQDVKVRCKKWTAADLTTAAPPPQTTTTTTTTTTTPRPTTTPAPPPPTTTTTTTTPRPTTTPAPPPPTTTTTTTTPRPTTTPAPPPQTTTRATAPRPTTTLTTLATPSTTTPVVIPPVTTQRPRTTTGYWMTTQNPGLLKGDGKDDDQQDTMVALAIVLPIVAFLFVCAPFIVWLFCVTRRRSKPILVNTTKYGSENILNNFIDNVDSYKSQSYNVNTINGAVVMGVEKFPITTFDADPNQYYIQENPLYAAPLKSFASLPQSQPEPDTVGGGVVHVKFGFADGDTVRYPESDFRENDDRGVVVQVNSSPSAEESPRSYVIEDTVVGDRFPEGGETAVFDATDAVYDPEAEGIIAL